MGKYNFFKLPKSIWDTVENPEICGWASGVDDDEYNQMTHYGRTRNIPILMGKLLYLFGKPTDKGDKFRVSREYHLGAKIDNKTVYFTCYDWQERYLSIGFEHKTSTLDERKRVVRAFWELLEETKEVKPFKDYFHYDKSGDLVYGVDENGQGYIGDKK